MIVSIILYSVFDGYLLIPYFIVQNNRCIINNKLCMFLARNKKILQHL
jgi:hypothetical protein